ncbi:MAG: hypothetical protein LUE99_17260 [Bacteroides sp.]|nr:hypothetical protein [Bacteroides sp.]
MGIAPKEDTGYFRLAYHPTQSPGGMDYWSRSITFTNDSYKPFFPIWGEAVGTPESQYDYGYKELFEVCPKGYHRPSDGPIDRIAYNGMYPNYFDRNDNDRPVVVLPTNPPDIQPADPVDHTDDILSSEWRLSLFKNPRGGDAATQELRKEGLNVDRVPNFWEGVNTSSNEEVGKYISLLIGFYADGFFDCRPIKYDENDGAPYAYGVSTENADAAYRGIVIYNENNNASVFFPLAGRCHNQDGNIEFSGTAGYYHSASTGASSYETPHSVWSFTLGKWPPHSALRQLPTFAQSIRCVKDEIRYE